MEDEKESLEYGVRRAVQTNKITELATALLSAKKATDFVVEVFDKDYNMRRITIRARVIDQQVINPFNQKKLYNWVKE